MNTFINIKGCYNGYGLSKLDNNKCYFIRLEWSHEKNLSLGGGGEWDRIIHTMYKEN